MGGHGGLNILPQKSWNVYGRENRLKVIQDEAKEAEEEAVRQEKHQQAEREYRHAQLLRRARERSGAQPSLDQAPAATEEAEDIEAMQDRRTLEVRPRAEVAVSADSKQPGRAQAEGGVRDFLQLWAADDAKAQHPEVIEEQKKEERRRGDKKTRTSDARFDAQFTFGHNLAGPAHQPWYAKKGSTLPAEESESKIAQKSLPASVTQLQTLSLPAPGDETCTGKEGRRDRKKEKRKKEEKKEQRRKGKKGKELQLDALRRERREREAAEKLRQRQVIMGGRAGEPEGSKRYHGAFGYARAR